MKKLYLFIFLFFLFLLLCASCFLIGKKLFTGFGISDGDKADYSFETASDKDNGLLNNCLRLNSGKIVCKVGTIEISEGEIIIP